MTGDGVRSGPPRPAMAWPRPSPCSGCVPLRSLRLAAARLGPPRLAAACPCALLDLDDGARVEPDDEHTDEEAENPEDGRARAVDLLNLLEEAYVIMSKKRQDIQRLLDEKQRIADHAAATGEWKASRVHQHARDALIARPRKEYEGKPADAKAIRLDLIRLGVAGRDRILTT